MEADRDLRIDALRGLALVGMTITHLRLPGMQQLFPKFGYLGVAEAFVLLSGLVAGMLYWRLAERQPAAELWARSLRRAGFLYLVYLGLAFGIIALTLGLRRIWPDFAPYHAELITSDPWLAVLLVPPLIFQPGFADILPMYFVFVAATPGVVLLARSGRLWLCIAVSALLWLLAQLGLGDALMLPVAKRFYTSLPYFDILGWQAVYLAGLVLGMRRAQGCDPLVPHSRALLVVAAALVALFLFTSFGGFGAPSRPGALGWLEDRSSFGPLRALNLAAASLVVTRLGALRAAWFEARWLAFLGAHSLAVFVYSCFLAYVMTPLAGASPPVFAAGVGIAVASLTFPALLQQRYRAARISARAGSEVAAPVRTSTSGAAP